MPIFLCVILILFVHVAILYRYQSSTNSYISYLRGIAPLPLIVVGNHFVTMSDYTKELALYRRIYSSVYRVNFSSEGKGYNDIQELKDFVQQTMINRIVLQKTADSFSLSVSTQDIDSAIEELQKNVGSREETFGILKFASGLSESDLRKLMYYDLLEKKVKERVLYQVRLDGVVIDKTVSYDSRGKKASAAEVAQDTRDDIAAKKISFSDARSVYKSQSKDLDLLESWYVFGDIPSIFRTSLDDIKKGEVGGVVETEGSYFILQITEERGYFRGTYFDLLKNQRDSISVRSFLTI